jgi:hypothetical protein
VAEVGDWIDVAEGLVVEATVTGHNKGGLECQVGSMRAFMPISQVGLYRVEDAEQYVGQKLACVVTQADPTRRNPMRYIVVGTGIHLGELDFVFGILEQLSEGDLGVGLDMSRGPIWKLSPAHAAFRSDPRFAALMEQIGLVEYWETYGWADRCRPEGASFACS